MTAIPEIHEQYGGLLTTRAGRRVVAQYGRPERTYRAVRNVAGVIEHGVGVVQIDGPDRRQAVSTSLTNERPAEDEGVYGFVLRDGVIAADAYVFDAGDRLLAFVPGDRIETVTDVWDGEGRTVTETTRDLAVFGVYGPQATEAIASVATATTPEKQLSIARGAIREAGVTVIRDDNLTGEEGYLVVATREDAADVFDAMVNRGLNAAPFGYVTWEALTLEAGTPLFESELRDADPGTVGVTNAYPADTTLDGTGRRLRAFSAATVPVADTTVYVDGDDVGHVTRAVESPAEETAIGFAIVEDAAGDTWTIGEDEIDATAATLPFVTGSDESSRIPVE